MMVTKKPLLLLSVAACAILATCWWFVFTDAPLTSAVNDASTAEPMAAVQPSNINSTQDKPDLVKAITGHQTQTDSAMPTAFGADAQQAFLELLHRYAAGSLSHDDKLGVEQTIREWNAVAEGQALLVNSFFSDEDPALAASMYDLFLDADLKDPTLITQLIQRDASEADTQFKARIIDLIADLNALTEVPYLPEIDDYLSQLADHPDTKLREAARNQQMWYTAHQSKDTPALDTRHLLDPSPNVRREMFDLIETRLAEPNFIGQDDIAISLQSLQRADYLDISQQERERIDHLLQRLGVNGLE